ncbi:MAG: hypothetical protein ACR2MG_07245 [Pyrinomonadaceae bacterium]
MKIQLLPTNLVLVAALFFNLAFVCGNDNRSGESTSTENQDEETINQTENQDVQGPRLGKYDILSYGNPKNPPIRHGHFELLSGGKYKFYDNGGNFKSEGKYRFDAATSTVEWLSGIFKDDGWGGAFTIEREGKTHNIRLKRTTNGTNSTD